MSLFDWIKIKQEDTGEVLKQYSGMRLEVMDMKERLLFVARAVVSWEDKVMLQPATTPRIRKDTKNYPVLLRGYRDEEKKAIHMQCRITARRNGMWEVSDLRVLGKYNDRAYFRQGTTLDAEIVPIRQIGIASLPCHVMDISVGGACIRAREEFVLGEQLLLKLELDGNGKVTPILCSVRRGVKRMGFYEYGCEFVDVSREVEATVTAAIMAMQREHPRRR